MINPNHKYKITSRTGVTLITYNDYTEAREFMKNMAKERNLKLQIKRQEINRDSIKKNRRS